MYDSVTTVADTRSAPADGEVGSEECLTWFYHHEVPSPTPTKVNRRRGMGPQLQQSSPNSVVHHLRTLQRCSWLIRFFECFVATEF